MTWNELLDRLRDAGLQPVEETYTEQYGKVLAVERPEFKNRQIRCAYGIVRCENLPLEVFVFPSDGQLEEFVEVIHVDAWWIAHANVLLHLLETDRPESNVSLVEKISAAIRQL